MSTEAQRLIDASMTEATFRTMVMDAAQLHKWTVYYTRDSRLCTASGFYDLVLMHSGKGRIIFRELKTVKGRVSSEQKVWLEVGKASGLDVGIWKPQDWTSIIATLQAA